MPEHFRVVCIPYKALYKCPDLPFTFTLFLEKYLYLYLSNILISYVYSVSKNQ